VKQQNLLALLLLLALVLPLTACSSDDPELCSHYTYFSYDSEQEYRDAARSDPQQFGAASDVDRAYYRLKVLPEGAEFNHIQVRQGRCVTTTYRIPYDEKGFGKPMPEDAYLAEQSTTIVLNHFFGDQELQFEQQKNALQMSESVTHNGTEYFYHFRDDCAYDFGFFRDGFAVFAAIPAFAPVEELLPYLEIDIILP